MSIFVALVALSSIYVGQNKQIDENYKIGFFAVVGVISVLAVVFNLLGGN